MKDTGDEPTRMAVLVSLFLFRGPFGLGGLWENGRFERSEKYVLTAAVLVHTAVLFAVIYLAAAALYRHMTLL